MFRAKNRIGDMLVAKGLIAEVQRAQAVALAEQSGAPLGEAVVSLGFATEEAVAQVVAEQYGYTYVSRENKLLAAEADQKLDRLIPEAFARQYLAFPLFLDRGLLSAAIARPEDPVILENLRTLTGVEIQPFVATKTQILKAIDQFYQKVGTDLIARAITSSEEAPELTAEDLGDVRLDLDAGIIGGGDGAQAVQIVNAVLKQAIAERSSDIHLEAFDQMVMLRFRIDGILYDRTPPPWASYLAIVSRLKILAKLDISEKRLPQDGAFSLKAQNRVIFLRMSACPAAAGEKIVLRLLDKGAVPLDFDRLGLEPRQRDDFLNAARLPHGLILLTGPTGSGKTTTLYAMLQRIKTPERNFMSVEDPIEMKLKGITQVQVRPSIGLDFAAVLRSFLRQDPDVLFVGEVRDGETAQTCLRAAITGHVVLSTLHTNDALSCVARLVDLGVEPFLLSTTLTLVAAQRLVRVLCPGCRKDYRPSAELAAAASAGCRLDPPPDPSRIVFYRSSGCPACAGTGFSGRLGIYEVYRIGPEVRDAIFLKATDLGALHKAVAGAGMWGLRASGWRKVLEGVTTVEEILSATAE